MKRREQLKLDQMMRLLFKLSKRLTLDLINGLFGDAFTIEEVRAIHYSNTEFVDDTMRRFVGDLHMKLETASGMYR